ncbi:RNA polymerase sigma-70 factor [Sphingobacterium sp. LRF_L2]|uniref:RNA polymerase sigma-70 factor n=1 Tax=Sphingobacterium sp. LRF_L2 TaxID=3369421 RepID=UPI003F62BDAA
MLVEKGTILDFKDFYLTYKDKVYRYAYMHFRDEDLAFDIVQEAFSKIWTKWEQLDIERNFQSYLYSITRNLVFDELRKRQVRHQYSELKQLGVEAEDNSNEESIAYRDLEKLYKEAISKLPKSRLEIYTLSKEEFLKNSEIAERLGLSVNTVREHIVKSNKFVRGYILERTSISLALLIFFDIF